MSPFVPVSAGPSLQALPGGRVGEPKRRATGAVGRRWIVALAEAMGHPSPSPPGWSGGPVSLVPPDPYARFAHAWREAEDRPDAARRQVLLAYDHFHAMVHATASRMLDDPAEAEDVSQAVFETLARRRTAVRDPAAVGAFLKTCTVRRSLALVRKRRRWRRRRAHLFVAPPAGGDPDAELIAGVRQVLGRLPPEERSVVVLRHVERHSLAEVAALTDSSVSTVQRRLRIAAQRLRAALREGADPVLAQCVASMDVGREVGT